MEAIRTLFQNRLLQPMLETILLPYAQHRPSSMIILKTMRKLEALLLLAVTSIVII